MEKLLRTSDVIEITGLSKSKVAELIARGEIPSTLTARSLALRPGIILR